MWAFVALTNYLKSLTGEVVDVGVSEGVQGGLQAVAAIVAGFVGKLKPERCFFAFKVVSLELFPSSCFPRCLESSFF